MRRGYLLGDLISLLIAWQILLSNDVSTQTVSSNLTACDNVCQATQRDGLIALYNSLNGKSPRGTIENLPHHRLHSVFPSII